MKSIQEYLKHVDECEALARSAATQEQRETILEMARAWRMLAETRQRLLRQGYVAPQESE